MPASPNRSRTFCVAGSHTWLVYLSKNLAAGVLAVLEALEGAAALAGDPVRRTQRVEEHRIEVDVREVDALFAAVEDSLTGEVAAGSSALPIARPRSLASLIDGTESMDV